MSFTAALGQGENFFAPVLFGLHTILFTYTTLKKLLISHQVFAQQKCQVYSPFSPPRNTILNYTLFKTHFLQ